jgi:CDP-diacylglycerol---serine O-phosphatidyltransferase
MHSKGNGTRRLRAISALPSLVTLLNAVCGFAAINFAAAGMDDPGALWLEKPRLTYFAAAGYMIFLGMVADALDGRIARMSNATSDLGEQLDSMADMVTFGIAPAFLMLRVVSGTFGDIIGPVGPAFGSMGGKLLWVIAVGYLCCAALRLARFNLETSPDEASHEGFSGLPSPAAAGLVASLVILCTDLLPELHSDLPRGWVVFSIRLIILSLPAVTLIAAALMVSRVRYVHAMNRYLRGCQSFGQLLRLLVVLLVVWWNLQLTLSVAFIGFAASPLFARRRDKANPSPAPDHESV